MKLTASSEISRAARHQERLNNDQAQDLKEAGELAGQTAEQQVAVAEQIQNKPEEQEAAQQDAAEAAEQLEDQGDQLENAMEGGKS